MSKPNRRRTIIVVILLLLIVLVLVLTRCTPENGPAPSSVGPSPVSSSSPSPASLPAPAAVATPAPEVLTPAILQAPATVLAGATFSVTWTGPNNDGDYVTIVRQDASERASGAYTLTRSGSPLSITAPVEPAANWELRYIAARSRQILGRTPVNVTPAAATLDAAGSVGLDSPLSITWTGPNNAGDFLTIVERNAPDRTYGPYTNTSQGSPLTVRAPPVAGDGEIRYLTGQGGKVLARRPVKITTPEVTLAAPAEGIAGANVTVTWTGPANSGDYITVVAKDRPDGQSGNYVTLSSSAPVKLRLPMDSGEAEIRYVTGRGAKVIGRRAIRIVAAEVSLSAPAAAAVNAPISVTWIGPANEGDFVTIVARGSPDSQVGNYTLTHRPSPLTIAAPKSPGEAELRYLSGQGQKILARRPITITP